MEQFNRALKLLPTHIWMLFTPTQVEGEPRAPLPSAGGSSESQEHWERPSPTGVSPGLPGGVWEVGVQTPLGPGPVVAGL